MRFGEEYMYSMFSNQLLLDSIQENRRSRLYENADVNLVREGQDSMTTPWLGVWICDLTAIPAEIDDVVDETTRDLRYVGDLPRCLLFTLELEDPLKSGIYGDRGGMSMKTISPCSLSTCSNLWLTNYPNTEGVIPLSRQCHAKTACARTCVFRYRCKLL